MTGLVQKGAHADMNLSEGNPTETLDLVADPDRIFEVVTKVGTIHKNTTSNISLSHGRCLHPAPGFGRPFTGNSRRWPESEGKSGS
jgi:hypothetical protein